MVSQHVKIANYAGQIRTLLRGGATLRSIILFPVRRRLRDARCQIDLNNGVTLVSPPDEPFIALFEEVWVDRCYRAERLALRPGDTILDIGAHVGLFSVWSCVNFPGVRV